MFENKVLRYLPAYEVLFKKKQNVKYWINTEIISSDVIQKDEKT